MTEPGPLSEEAVRLVGAAQDWWHRMVGDPATARIATGAPECCWCPLCQLIATLRGERPELLDRLAETQATLIATLRALAEAAGLGSGSGWSHRPAEDSPAGDSPAEDSPAGDPSAEQSSTGDSPTEHSPADQAQPRVNEPEPDTPKPPRTRKRGSRVQPIPLDDEAG